jgi:hypothetical protein
VEDELSSITESINIKLVFKSTESIGSVITVGTTSEPTVELLVLPLSKVSVDTLVRNVDDSISE